MFKLRKKKVTKVFVTIRGEGSIWKIKSGRNGTIGEYGYVVRIETITELGYNPICSGAVLTTTKTLTAAHCLKSMKTSIQTYIKCFGCGTNSTANIYPNETQAHPHYLLVQTNPDYEDILYNDIAVIRHEPIHLLEYGKVSAVEYTSLFGKVAFAAGYGISERYQKRRMKSSSDSKFYFTSDYQLKVLDVLLMKCNVWLCRSHYPAMLGASKNDSTLVETVCFGDSGGPLIHDSRIVGVIVSGRCDLKRTVPAGIFTPTSPYLRWLRDSVTSSDGLE